MQQSVARMALRLMGALALASALALLAACGAERDHAPVVPLPTQVNGTQAITLARLPIEVHRSALCGCCEEYESYLTGHGMVVSAVVRDDLGDLKEGIGLPVPLSSCHTAFVGGYFIEGHVPIEAIRDLLEQQPLIDGIALPGMPAGSPGMGGTQRAPFVILAVVDGAATEFGLY